MNFLIELLKVFNISEYKESESILNQPIILEETAYFSSSATNIKVSKKSKKILTKKQSYKNLL